MSQYPKTQRAAARFARKLDARLARYSGLTEVGVVANTDFALAQGYVIATAQKGPVRVVGMGLGTLMPGMRIFLRPMTGNVSIFDGLAPTPLTTGTASGSLVSTGLGLPPASTPIQTGMPTLSLPSGPATGWYWSCFFYLAALPSPGATFTLIDLPKINTTTWTVEGGWRVTYDWLGRVNAYPYGSAYGNPAVPEPTVQTFSPHRIWFLTAQIGNGLAINGLQNDKMGLSGLNSIQTVLPGNYGLFLLGDSTGGTLAPHGSWISKVSIGNNFASGSPVWPYNLSSFIPSSDAQLANGNKTLGSGLRTMLFYSCQDSVGTTTLLDSSAIGSNLSLSVSSTVLVNGPY